MMAAKQTFHVKNLESLGAIRSLFLVQCLWKVSYASPQTAFQSDRNVGGLWL